MDQIENFSSDKPISNKKDDKFQRYEFSKRIAQTISKRKEDDCIVIGVYGAWGEGKTSVINFIEKEIKSDPKIISIKFNPWRYGDEASLLKQFFQQFAIALDAQLNTKSEKIGEVISKYSKLLNFDIPVVGNLGESVQGAGELLKSVDIEVLKDRIETIIKETEKRIVVFVDDIDRLDKVEIYSIFRLVKLNADFKNTTYVLSFDEEMVSSAIGDRFGNGNQDAGRNFLEKIVQVPLNIPVAQPQDLKDYCFKLIEDVVKSNGIDLSEAELARFVYQFSNNILGRLHTPRLAVRYSNNLSFSLPLLKGEVNMVDLMLIEALKVFYPNHYKLVKEHSEFFIGNYKKGYSSETDSEKINEANEHFTALNKNFSQKEKKEIKDLLLDLFPSLEVIFRSISFSDRSGERWIKEKRIVSPWYFNRYFSYAVIRGEISDIAFQQFLSTAATESEEVVGNDLKGIVASSSPDTLILKLRVMEDEMPWELAKKISKAIGKVSDIFPNDGKSFFFSYSAPLAQIAIYIKRLIKSNDNIDDQLSLSKELISECKDIVFAFELRRWLLYFDNDKKQLFNEEQNSELTSLVLIRARNEAGEIPLFVKFPEQADYLLTQWHKDDPIEFKSYIESLINNSPKNIISLISSFAPSIKSSSHPIPYKTDLTKYEFEQITSILDKDYIRVCIENTLTSEELDQEVIWTGREGGLTEVMLALQFRSLSMPVG